MDLWFGVLGFRVWPTCLRASISGGGGWALEGGGEGTVMYFIFLLVWPQRLHGLPNSPAVGLYAIWCLFMPECHNP